MKAGGGTMLGLKAASVLSHFFVAQPGLGAKEGEEEKKLLFFWPHDEKLDNKIQSVGFAEAVMQFTREFARRAAPEEAAPPSCDFHKVTTSKHVHVYLTAEADFVFGLAASRPKAAALKYHLYAPALEAVLRTAADMFRLFFGRLGRSAPPELRQRLDYFFTRYLGSLRLEPLPLLDLFPGISFVTLDALHVLRVKTAISRLGEVFPQIRYSMFLYQDQLLWYSVPRPSLRILYRYLSQNLLPMSLRAELQPQAPTRRRTTSSSQGGKFLTGPRDLDSAELMAAEKPPIVHIPKADGEASSTEEFQLVVYRALNATLAALVPADAHLDMPFFRNLDAMLGPELSKLGSEVGELYAATSASQPSPQAIGTFGGRPPPPEFHYVYFNPVSGCLVSNLATAALQPPALPPPLPPAVAALLCTVRDELRDGTGYLGEVVAKSVGEEFWVAGKAAHGRLLLTLLSQPHASLVEAAEELRRLTKDHFRDLFLLE